MLPQQLGLTVVKWYWASSLYLQSGESGPHSRVPKASLVVPLLILRRVKLLQKQHKQQETHCYGRTSASTLPVHWCHPMIRQLATSC